ncbi:TBC1 domain family member 2A [Hondaea fermentalgiana]|uniref:TBC1 domain family member 2A n=1 Tax=Hondaea fermentalgiana TaxID=2315210 RepID=A0A2R5GFB7_9STRA|nr:TBC1 domain family member 2A [Hondaea fermentalgiana]|eukprot:GBG27323.1 TBC1 domain family member 2A [Hondaea fermentalgiana]
MMALAVAGSAAIAEQVFVNAMELLGAMVLMLVLDTTYRYVARRMSARDTKVEDVLPCQQKGLHEPTSAQNIDQDTDAAQGDSASARHNGDSVAEKAVSTINATTVASKPDSHAPTSNRAASFVSEPSTQTKADDSLTARLLTRITAWASAPRRRTRQGDAPLRTLLEFLEPQDIANIHYASPLLWRDLVGHVSEAPKPCQAHARARTLASGDADLDAMLKVLGTKGLHDDLGSTACARICDAALHAAFSRDCPAYAKKALQILTPSMSATDVQHARQVICEELLACGLVEDAEMYMREMVATHSCRVPASLCLRLCLAHLSQSFAEACLAAPSSGSSPFRSTSSLYSLITISDRKARANFSQRLQQFIDYCATSAAGVGLFAEPATLSLCAVLEAEHRMCSLDFSPASTAGEASDQNCHDEHVNVKDSSAEPEIAAVSSPQQQWITPERSRNAARLRSRRTNSNFSSEGIVTTTATAQQHSRRRNNSGSTASTTSTGSCKKSGPTTPTAGSALPFADQCPLTAPANANANANAVSDSDSDSGTIANAIASAVTVTSAIRTVDDLHVCMGGSGVEVARLTSSSSPPLMSMSAVPPPVPARVATSARAEVISGDLLFRMLEGCKRKYKAGGRRRRVSYTHPLFKELLEAFSALTERGGKCARVEVWRLVALRAEAEMAQDTGYFWKLDVSDENVDEASRIQIEKDIARSGSLWDSLPEEQALAWRGRLRHILRAYAVHDRRNGYTQGMNLFAAEFLFVTASEELSFWLVMHVCYTSRIAPDYFTSDIAGLKRDVWVVQQLLEQYFPELMAHLKKCDLDVSYLFIGPLLSLFCSVLPPGSSRLHQFYDVMLANGETTLFAALLSLFKMSEPSLMQQTDSGSLMDTLNLSLETMQSSDPAFIETFHRSLLQWCMALDPGTIADFRKSAPMHWCNMDVLLQMARERDQELLSAHTSSGRRTSNAPSALQPSTVSSSTPLTSSSTSSPLSFGGSRYRLKLFSNQSQSQSQNFQRNSTGDGGNAALQQNGASPHGLSGTEDASSRQLNLRIVWIVSNLRHPFANATAEEYRQAAIATCTDILKRNGYAEILLQQHSDLGRGPGPPTSASPLLPGTMTNSDGGATLQHKKDATDVWRAPDSYLGMRALLEGLMDALLEASRDVSEENSLMLLLDRLYQCIRTSRDAIPLYKNSSALLDELFKLIAPSGAETVAKVVPWRKKLRNVFLPRRSSGTSSSATPSAASAQAASPTASLTATAGSAPGLGTGPGAGAGGRFDSLEDAGLGSAGIGSGGLLGSLGSDPEVEDKDRQEWRTHLVLLLLARKVHAENQEIRLYETLDAETGTRISSLYDQIAEALRGDIDAAILNASSSPTDASAGPQATRNGRRPQRSMSPAEEAATPLQSSDTEEDADTLAPTAEFNHAFDYQLRVWSLDRGATLYLATWAHAREMDLRSTQKALGAHRRFKSYAPGRGDSFSPSMRSHSRRSVAGSGRNELSSAGSSARGDTSGSGQSTGGLGLDEAVADGLGPPFGVKKSRSRSSPLGAQTSVERGGEVPRLSREVPVTVRSLQHLDVHKVREISLSNSQHWRALYWALRSNYHLTLEMSQLADVAATVSCRALIKELASYLHTSTYNMQAKLCDAARVDHIALQIETFDGLLSGQSADAESHANQVLLDDLSDQVKLCHVEAWRVHFGDQLATIQGQIIL